MNLELAHGLFAPLPTGSSYEVVEVGGSFLRIVSVDWKLDVRVHHRIRISHSDREHLIETVAKQIASIPAVAKPLSIVWSFPLRNGCCTAVGKGFPQSLVGLDVAAATNKALEDIGSPARVVALVNDGTAAMIAARFVYASCSAMLIVGTGINIHIYDAGIYNTEISFLDLGITPPDLKTAQPLEDLVGGRAIERMVSSLAGRPVGFEETWDALNDGKSPLHRAAQSVINNAAILVAASLYGILLFWFPKVKVHTVCYTGSIISQPAFLELVRQKMNVLRLHYATTVDLVRLDAGPQLGAAILAANIPVNGKNTSSQ